mgnify:CR=1 FL=1
MVPHGKGICQEYEAFCQILGNTLRVTEWLKNGEKKSGKDFVENNVKKACEKSHRSSIFNAV